MTSNSNDVLGSYKAMFKGWQVKALGPAPTAEQLAIMHGLGLRPGKQALACAMAVRDTGVTGAQIVMACGAPQLNRMRGLIAAGVVKREAVPANDLGHTVYKLTLTPKGSKAIERAAAAAAKATLETGDAPAKAGKAKGKGKAAAKAKGKAKAKAATSDATPPVSDAAPVLTSDATPPVGDVLTSDAQA